MSAVAKKMYFIINFLIMLVLLIGCTASNTPHMKSLITEASKKETKEGVIHKDVLYKSTLMHDLTLDIYEPLVKRESPSPIYLYIHGGSWLRGDKNLVNIYDRTMKILREAGVTVVSINYRFVSQSGVEAMVSDCFDAVKFLQKHAGQYHLDAHHIGLHGHSAGANLALVLGLTLSKTDDDIMFIVDEYGPTDAVKLIKEQESAPWWSHLMSDQSLEEISPLFMVHPKAPPVYIAHGDQDRTVPFEQSLVIYKKLQQEGIPSMIHTIHGADHGYAGVSDEVIKVHRQEVLGYLLKQFQGIDSLKY